MLPPTYFMQTKSENSGRPTAPLNYVKMYTAVLYVGAPVQVLQCYILLLILVRMYEQYASFRQCF